MFFFSAFYKSTHDVKWIKEKKFSRRGAWGYFSLLILLTSLVSLIPVASGLPAFHRDLKNGLEKNVPTFNAELKSGKLSVTGLPQDPFMTTVSEGDYTWVIAVDTRAGTETNAEKLARTTASGTAKAIVFKADQVEIFDGASGQGRTQAWQGMKDIAVDKSKIAIVLDKVMGWPGVLILGTVFTLASYIGSFLGWLVSLVLVSLFTLLICRLTARKLSFGQLFTMGLYATTLPAIIDLLVFIFRINAGGIGFIALLAFMLAVVFTEEKEVRLEN